MARKNNLRPEGSTSVHFDVRTKAVMAEATSENIKKKVQAVREVVPGKSNNDIVMVLQYYDCSVERTIQAFLEDDAKEVLQQWSFTGSKQPNKNRKSKKKSSDDKAPDRPESCSVPKSVNDGKRESETSEDAKLPNGDIVRVDQSNADSRVSPADSLSPVPEQDDGAASALAAVSDEAAPSADPQPQRQPNRKGRDHRSNQPNRDSHHPHHNSHQPNRDSYQPYRDSHQPNRDSHQPHRDSHQPNSDSHQPNRDSHQPHHDSHQPHRDSHQPNRDSHQPHRDSHQPHRDSHQPNRDSHQPNRELLHSGRERADREPGAGDGQHGKPRQGLEKAIKDLQRQTTSLARLRLVLDHEIDRSYKSLKAVFEDLRHGLNEREAQLMAEMNVLKNEASKILEMRQEKAADLRTQVDRSDKLKDLELSELRAEIKHFVSERRHDNDISHTTRFLYDSDHMLNEIKKFGDVVHVKPVYTVRSVSVPSVPSSDISHEGNSRNELSHSQEELQDKDSQKAQDSKEKAQTSSIQPSSVPSGLDTEKESSDRASSSPTAAANTSSSRNSSGHKSNQETAASYSNRHGSYRGQNQGREDHRGTTWRSRGDGRGQGYRGRGRGRGRSVYYSTNRS